MSNIKINAQYIKDLSFEIPGAPEIFLSSGSKPDISLAIDIDAKKLSDDAYEVALKIKADAEVSNKKLFICEVVYAGIFGISNIEKEMVEQVLLVYCPNLLFPFARRVIASTVSDGGFPPLMLEPIDFAALYEKRKKAN